MLEAKAKDQGHRRKCCPPQKKNVFKNSFQVKRRSPIEVNKERSSQNFHQVSGVSQQNFNGSKNSAVLEPMTGQFSRTGDFDLRRQVQVLQNVSSRPRTSSRTPLLIFTPMFLIQHWKIVSHHPPANHLLNTENKH